MCGSGRLSGDYSSIKVLRNVEEDFITLSYPRCLIRFHDYGNQYICIGSFQLLVQQLSIIPRFGGCLVGPYGIQLPDFDDECILNLLFSLVRY